MEACASRADSQITLVLTKSDDIGDPIKAAAREDPVNKDKIIEYQRLAEELGNALALVDKNIRAAGESGDTAELVRLWQRQFDFQARKKRIINEMTELVIVLRNRRIERKWQTKYKALTSRPTAELEVICVSSAAFREHLKPGAPALSLEATGIPRLYERFALLPGAQKFKDTYHHSAVVCPNALARLSLYCSTDKIKQKDSWEVLIDETHEKCTQQNTRHFESFKETKVQRVVGEIAAQEVSWNAITLEKLNYMNDHLKPGMFQTLMRKGGTHHPRNGDEISLSLMFAAVSGTLLSRSIDSIFSTDTPDLWRKVFADQQKLVANMQKEIKKSPGGPEQQFSKFLKTEFRSMLCSCKKHEQDMTQFFR